MIPARAAPLDKVEIYGWTVNAGSGWHAIAVAIRVDQPLRQRRLTCAAASAEEALETLVKLTASLAAECRKRGKRVLLRMLKEPPGSR